MLYCRFCLNWTSTESRVIEPTCRSSHGRTVPPALASHNALIEQQNPPGSREIFLALRWKSQTFLLRTFTRSKYLTQSSRHFFREVKQGTQTCAASGCGSVTLYNRTRIWPLSIYAYGAVSNIMILLEKRFLVLESLLTLFPLPFSELSGQDFCPRHSIGGFFSFFWAGFGMVLVHFILPTPPPPPAQCRGWSGSSGRRARFVSFGVDSGGGICEFRPAYPTLLSVGVDLGNFTAHTVAQDCMTFRFFTTFWRFRRHILASRLTPPLPMIWQWLPLTYYISSLSGRPHFLLLIFLGAPCRLRSLAVQR